MERISKKAQSAVEFMIIVMFLVFLMIILFEAIYENRAAKINAQRDIFMNDVALAIKDEINLAHSASDGYMRIFKVPAEAFGVSFNASIREGDIYLASYDGKHALAHAVANVTGDVKIGDNLIEKINGSVYLNRI